MFRARARANVYLLNTNLYAFTFLKRSGSGGLKLAVPFIVCTPIDFALDTRKQLEPGGLQWLCVKVDIGLF